MSMPLLWKTTLRNFLFPVCSSRVLEEEGGVLNLTRYLTNTQYVQGSCHQLKASFSFLRERSIKNQKNEKNQWREIKQGIGLSDKTRVSREKLTGSRGVGGRKTGGQGVEETGGGKKRKEEWVPRKVKHLPVQHCTYVRAALTSLRMRDEAKKAVALSRAGLV